MAEYRENVKVALQISSSENKANMDWMLKLRQWKRDKNKVSTEINESLDKASLDDTSKLQKRSYNPADVPKVYYKQMEKDNRKEKRQYKYKGNF